MIFEIIKATPLCKDRKSLHEMYTRRKSAANLHENKVQVLVMGASKAGVTSLIDRLVREKIVYDAGKDTKENDVHVEIIVELMDIQDTLDTQMRKFAILTAHAYILMYSMDDSQSFFEIDALKDEIMKVKGPGMPMILVGNKADLSKSKVKSTIADMNGIMDGQIPHIKLSLCRGRHFPEIYQQLFKHHTLRKLTDVVSKINSSSLFTDLRRLSMRAEQLEESISMMFSPTTNSKCTPRYRNSQDRKKVEGEHSIFSLKKLKSVFHIGK